MEYFNQLKVQFTEFWKKLDTNSKVLIFLFSAAIIIALAVATFLHSKPSFGLLYSGLEETTASEIVSELEDSNVAYELKNKGTTIYVERSKINKVRLMLREKDLPKEGTSVGYELFDKSQFGVTDFEQKIRHRRALEGELSRTITQIRNVLSTRVHINLPKERLFQKDKKVTTASVILNLKYEGAVEMSQVESIRKLTAAAVDGLKPNNVTVVDNFGNVLGAPNDDEMVGQLTGRVGIQKSVEMYYSKKVQGLMEPVVGRNNVVVRVDALLDFDKVEETQEKYDPESAVVRSEVISTEKSNGTTSNSKGAPGLQSNTQPGSKKSSNNSQENKSSRETIKNKYEIDRQIKHIIKGVGDLKKLTVSVFIKQKTEQGEEGKSNVVPRSAEELSAFIEVVQNAIGFNEERGDKVAVKEVPFEKAASPVGIDLGESSSQPIDWPQIFRTVIEAGFIIAVFMMFRSFIRRKEEIPEFLLSENQRKKEAGTEGLKGDGMVDQGQIDAIEKGALLDSKVTKLIEDSPSESERVLKDWLKE